MNKFVLSVVIPSYNEMANLQKGTLDKVEHYLSKQKYDFEIIVVDDGSTDGSREFVKKFSKENKKVRIIEGKHSGKAGAVTTGVLSAKGDYILFTDMDQATPIEEIEKLLPHIENGFDVVIGSRQGQRKGAPFTRKVMAKSMIFLRSAIVGIPSIKDTQCGFKLFKKNAAKDIFTRVEKVHNGFRAIKGSSVAAGFDIEVLFVAENMGYKIKEVEVIWLYVETRRVSPLKDSVDGFMDLLRIRKNIISGVYD
jgi:glycosyltransferase involved in cell wall biosynthesis